MRGLIPLALAMLIATAVAAQEDELLPLPVAPEVKAPGGEPPADLCVMEQSWNFEKEPVNPGLHTTAQYRRFAITDAATQNPEHLFLLGLMYEFGQGVGTDLRKAVEHYKRAAAMDLVRADARLGRYYCSRQLYCTSARYYFSAANADDPDGQMGLSKLYRWGLGVFYDPVEAMRWGVLAMEKTPGNWIVHDMDGVRYLRSLENILPDDEEAEATTRIDRWKRGFDRRVLKCRVDEELGE